MLDAFFLLDTVHDGFRTRTLPTTAPGVRAIAGNFDPRSDDGSAGSSDAERMDADIAAAECIVVFIGQNTAARQDVTDTVCRAVRDFDTPVIGIRIDKLVDENGAQGVAGDDPFTHSGLSARRQLQIETYDPQFTSSVFTRSHIRFSLHDWMELAIREAARRDSARGRRGATGSSER